MASYGWDYGRSGRSGPRNRAPWPGPGGGRPDLGRYDRALWDHRGAHWGESYIEGFGSYGRTRWEDADRYRAAGRYDRDAFRRGPRGGYDRGDFRRGSGRWGRP